MDFSKIRHIIFFCLLALATLAFLYMIRPFAYPILWAAITAGVIYPLFKWLNKKIRRPNLSAVLTATAALVLIVLPLFLISTMIISESIDLYNAIDNNRSQINSTVQDAMAWVRHNPFTAQFNIDDRFWMEKFSEITKTVTNFIFTSVKDLTQNSLAFIAMLVIMFYTLFFFLRDGEKMLNYLMHLCPLGDKYEKMLYKKFASTARATLKGTVIVGCIQGALGGLLFGLVGIQGAVIWGLFMAALSVIPPLSSSVIWLPAGIIMLLSGQIWQGVVILAFGTLVISTIDNFLKPVLIGKDTQMHPVLVLFSTLGGILLFGISGFVIGPILTSLLLAFWEMYEHYYSKELCQNNQNGL